MSKPKPFDIKRMTDKQVMDHLMLNTPLNKARAAFSSGNGRIEQRGQQRQAFSTIELRRMEFEETQNVLDAGKELMAAEARAEGAQSALRLLADALQKFSPDLCEALKQRWERASKEQSAALEELLAVLRKDDPQRAMTLYAPTAKPET